jgi:hypothetical protein
MKKKIILDILLYLGIPLLLWNYRHTFSLSDYYAIFLGLVPGLLYTILDFFRSKEFNVSGLFLMVVMVLNFIFNILSKNALQELWSGIYVSLILIVIYIVSMIARKPIGMFFFVDYAYAKGIPRKVSTERYSQKKYLPYFQWFTVFLATRELIVVVIKSIMIRNFGLQGFNTIQVVMNTISYAFVALTFLVVIRILKKIKVTGQVTTPIVVPE